MTTPANVPTKPYKAVAAFVVLVIGTLWGQLQGHDNLSTLGLYEWLAIIVPTVVGTAAVYGITNPATTNRGI